MGNMTEERTGQSDVEQVKERVHDATQQAKGQTREQLRTQIDERTTQAGAHVTSAAQAFRQAGEQLRVQGEDRVGTFVESLADRGERLGTYLTGADGNSVLREVEDFARRQPWLVTGAGAVAGFLAARFVKASSRTRYEDSSTGSPTPYYPSERRAAIPTAGGSSGIG